MDTADLVLAGLARQTEMVRSGDVSPRELVEACLERIERLDPQLNAFRVVLGERALAEAAQAGGRRGAGDDRPLLGVPVAIKDDTDVAGEITAVGTRAHGGPAAADAEVVRRLRAAGAIVIGKTHVPELVQWPFTESATWGVTRNPWDPERTPGGSSGGSGAAVAAGLVGGALGSDGAGSIRIPASFCGLFGLKPTRDLISIAPHTTTVLGWHGLAVYGPLARRVADAALFLDATAAEAPAEPFAAVAARPPERLRIAVSFKVPPGITAPLARVDAEVRAAVEETASVLRSLGHDVVRRDPAYGMVVNNVVARYLRGIHDDAHATAHPERLERRTRAMARMGGLISDKAIARETRAESGHFERIGALFADHDVLLTPATPVPAYPVGRFEGRGALWTLMGSAAVAPYTGPWNALGQPAASVPAGLTAAGLPMGVQLVGRRGADAVLLSLAAQLEAETGWPERRPPVS